MLFGLFLFTDVSALTSLKTLTTRLSCRQLLNP